MAADTLTEPTRPQAATPQRIEFRSGDEAAALAAREAGFDPACGAAATPVTALALCYGAALGGERVVCAAGVDGATALAQLAAQASARVPMVVNVAARAVAAPADMGCDHSGLYALLNAGCVVLCARDPQAVYDFNLAAIRIGEHPQVRLPVVVAYDAHVTSDGRRRVLAFDDAEALARFLGPRPPAATPLDTGHPATFGTTAECGFIDDKAALARAMEAARGVIPQVFAELAALTGRRYQALDAFAMDDAEAALVLLNSAAETAKEAATVWREEEPERKVGVLSPNVLRPFPAAELRARLRTVRAAVVADRADSYGASGGNLSLEVRAAIEDDAASRTRILSRVYGLGGADFHATDAERLLDQALDAAATGLVQEPFAYHGLHEAVAQAARAELPPIRAGEVSRGMAKVRRDEATGMLEVELAPLWSMTAIPSRIAPGHGACPGCGALSTLHQLYKVLEGDLVAVFQSGCAVAVTTECRSTAHRVSCVHEAAGHGAATLAGLAEAWRRRVARGELPGRDVTFVMVTGDGGLEADLGALIELAGRNPRMLVIEYDNQGRMSTGGQATRSTPCAANPGDTAQVLAACHLPYVFTAAEGYPEDFLRKAAKAQWYARNEGLAYGKVLSFCPLNWKTADDAAEPALQAAIDSCAFPLYEVERGRTTITYDPDAVARRKPVAEWLKLLGRSAHLAEAANAAALAAIQAETDRRWARLQAMHGHPLL